MSADHYIKYIWAKEDNARVIAAIRLSHMDSPKLQFTLPEGCDRITAYEWCTIHGKWANDPVAIKREYINNLGT